ncbi:MAG TPA: PDZ domain-containing protein, partial [Candidatus Polarisedimenticolia bacterium]|nr:PDZ domain-containing protein [Candidatus Polarisedimenticolia bacterium]
GGYHEGIIGATLFRHFAVSLDNDRSLMTLRRPEDYTPPEGAGVLPLVFDDGGKPFADARVRIADGGAKPIQLAVDLGASHVVSLNETEGNGLLAPAGSIAATIGRGVSGAVLGKVGRIASLELGPFKLEHLVATFPDKAYQNPRGMDSKDGNLGNGALSRFLVTFDYAHERLVLFPAAGFTEPSEWDMSGMQGDLTGKGTVEVSRVLAGSPAEAAGIRQGDTLVRIAGEEVTQASYFTLKERFKKDGETVTVELRRKDKPVLASLKLRRLV